MYWNYNASYVASNTPGVKQYGTKPYCVPIVLECIMFVNECIALLQYMIDFGKKTFDMRISNGYNSR